MATVRPARSDVICSVASRRRREYHQVPVQRTQRPYTGALVEAIDRGPPWAGAAAGAAVLPGPAPGRAGARPGAGPAGDRAAEGSGRGRAAPGGDGGDA